MMGSVDTPERSLKLVGPALMPEKPWLVIHAIRTAFLVCILVVSVIYQIQLGPFLNTEIWFPVYAVLLTVFLCNSSYLFFYERTVSSSFFNFSLFALDAFAISVLIYYTGTAQSLFLFLYLVNLVLAGSVFEQEGTWLLSLWTSICFSTLLIVSPEVSGQNLYFSLILNNLAFVSVTFLGGQFSSQLLVFGTRLKETQADLESLQDLNTSIVTNITTGLMVTSRTGFVQVINPAFEKMFLGRTWTQMKISDVLPEMGWPWESLVQNASLDFERREFQIQRQQLFIVEIVAARLLDANKKQKGWIFLVDDRTQEKLRDQEMKQKEKLAAVGQLAAGIAHEIRNPLASISGSVQLMLSSPGEQSEENLKLMRIMDKEINRLNGLITEFLEYVRPESRSNVPVQINSLVMEVLESFQFNAKVRKDVHKTLELSAQKDILGNRDKLKQAFLNLILNAYQALDKTEQPELSVQTVDEATKVVLVIKDNGCGIRPENLSRIFEPFHTTKTNGTGLGLAVTHKILEAHEARIFVDSEVGRGTRFTIEFPAFHHTEDLIPLRHGS